MIREYRERADITQLELSKALGFTSPQFISNIERGISKLPVKKFKKVSRILSIPIDMLIEHRVKQEEVEIRRVLRLK